jgi:hypothetical protein
MSISRRNYNELVFGIHTAYHCIFTVYFFFLSKLVDVPDYCVANPSKLLPDPDNCAHYFNCSDPTVAVVTRQLVNSTGHYRKECPYPDLFDSVLQQCQMFSSVKCNTRPEPQAPCMYLTSSLNVAYEWKHVRLPARLLFNTNHLPDC